MTSPHYPELVPTNATYWKNQAKRKDAEIERLNAQVAMLTDILTRATSSLCAFIGGEVWSQSDINTMDAVNATLCGGRNAFVALRWLSAHDAKVRDDALDDAADVASQWGYAIADEIRTLKGTKE